MDQVKDKEKMENRVYLSIPSLSDKALKNIINRLREEGAKYDNENRAWYISPDADFNRFKAFLGLPYEIVRKRGDRLRVMEERLNHDKEQRNAPKS